MYRAPRLVVADGDAGRRAALAGCLRARSGSEGAHERGLLIEESERATIGPSDDEAGTILIVAEDLAGPVIAELAASREASTGVVVVSKDGANAARFLEAGALDVWRWPLQEAEIPARLRSLLRVASAHATLAEKQRDARSMIELTQTLASSLEFSEILFTVVRRIAETVRVDRVSIVLSPSTEDPNVGYVVAASDNQGITNLRIDLEKYPEILEVLRTRAAVTIHDPATHPLLEGIRNEVPTGMLGAISLLPITWQDEVMGALFLRAPPGRGALSEREASFCRIVANATAVALRNARVMQTLRDQTQQVNFARFEAERRLRGLKRYADLFASAADGLAAIDQNGRVLFANPRAYDIVGASESELGGRSVLDLVPRAERGRLAKEWRKIRRGEFPRELDIRLRIPSASKTGKPAEAPQRTLNLQPARPSLIPASASERPRVSEPPRVPIDEGERIMCASFSALREGEGAVLLSFRDVTEERRMAAELRRTRDFLEGLIQATVDAIIASDLKGNVLLFNRGAERIYGWSADEVIGKRKVTELYPHGGAMEVMRLLRSSAHGGEGRLEQIRFEALDRDGNRIPIYLSAAILYDDGTPVATVGIFTDIREKLRVEERLAHATEKLAISEKQSIVAELAGTTAHELNQPLTSVMGYAELLRRKLPQSSPEHHAVSTIMHEAERMADIVKKIGKITKYETKTYVGGAKILDLDRASSDEPTGRTS
jgi:PAS domain S-box-containing protein